MNFSNLSSRLSGVQFRRSRLSDADGLVELLKLRSISEEGLPLPRQFDVRTAADFVNLIQTTYLSVTALSTVRKDLVVGFLALTDGPRTPGFPAHRWPSVLHSGIYTDPSQNVRLDEVLPCNTLWVSMLMAPPLQSHLTGTSAILNEDLFMVELEMEKYPYTSAVLARELFFAALNTANQISHILMASQTEFPVFGDMALKLQESVSASHPKDLSFKGQLLYVPREELIPHLQLREGRIEDYDDFVPLLVGGVGVLTELPANMYLEEILKDQNNTHKVAIAENSVSHEVVALACLHALSLDDQQALTKRYSTNLYGKLRPTEVRSSDAPGAAQTANTVQIDFLYMKPSYEGSSHELLQFIFSLFPSCEFAALILPHSVAEPQILRNFVYLPVRHYQPHNARGGFLPVPQGLWVSCCYSLMPLQVEVVRSGEGRVPVESFLSLTDGDIPEETRDVIQEDLDFSLKAEKTAALTESDQLPNTSVFIMTWNTVETVGIASARRLSVMDMYSLRANYDLDQYIHFNVLKPKDYSTTDISLTAKQGMLKFCTSEMRGVILHTMYVRPAFRNRIRLFVREIMRMYQVAVAVMLPMLGTETFQPLARELILARPRRVVELSRDEKNANHREHVEEPAMGAMMDATGSATHPLNSRDLGSPGDPVVDEGAVGSLFFTTARCLGDEKLRVNTRVVVVGAGATGLCLLHRLVTTPFVHFTNLLLVSTDGMPVHANQEPSLWRTDTMELLEREHIDLQIASPVRVVTGNMVDMDKVNRFISVDNGTFEPYDYLVLTTGRQYMTPAPIRRLLQQEGRESKNSVIALSGGLALDRLRHTLSSIDANPNNTANVVVYGSALDAFAVASTMIEENFAAQRIVICSPLEEVPHMDVGCYQAAVTLLRAMGTNVLRGYDVSRLEFDEDGNLVTVMLAPVQSDGGAGQSVELSCCLVVCVEDKDIDVNILSTLNKRSIVFDGRVIVDHNMRTTDPCVFAAGPVAMLTRRYGATPSFEDFSARDVGYKLSTVLMAFLGFDEFFRVVSDRGDAEDVELLGATNADTMADLYSKVLEESGSAKAAQKAKNSAAAKVQKALTPEEEVAKLRDKLPHYTTPLACRVRFPRGYNFFAVHSVDFKCDQCEALFSDNLDPSQYLPAGFGDDEGTDGAPVREEGRITIYIHQTARTIDAVTYFGTEVVEIHNYTALIGLPETILNLSFRYWEALQRAETSGNPNAATESELTADLLNGRLDIVKYLRLPHLRTVFSDKFADFFSKLRKRMKEHEESMQMREAILEKHQDSAGLSKEDVGMYQKELTSARSQFKYEVQLALITFLHDNKDFMRQNMFLPSVDKLVPKAQPITEVR